MIFGPFGNVVAGERPFPGDSAASIIYRIVHEDARPFPEDSPVPAALRELVRRCLAKAPAERPADGAELSEALRRFADVGVANLQASSAAAEPMERRGGTPAPPALPSGTRPPRSSLMPYLLGLVVLAAAAAAARTTNPSR